MITIWAVARHNQVTLTLIDGDDEYQIARERGSKTVLNFFRWAGKEKKEDPLTASTPTETQRRIAKLLGFSPSKEGFDDYLNTSYLTSSSTRLFSRDVEPAERIAFLSRMLGFDVLTEAAKLSRKKAGEIQGEIAGKEEGIQALQEELEGTDSYEELDGKEKAIGEEIKR